MGPSTGRLERIGIALILVAALVPRLRDVAGPFDRGPEGEAGARAALAAVNYERLGLATAGGYPVLNVVASGRIAGEHLEVDRAVEKSSSLDPLKKAPEFQNTCTNLAQKRAYQALSKHLILEIFFDTNAFQLELISGISNNKITDLSKHIQSQKATASEIVGSELVRSQGNSTAISS